MLKHPPNKFKKGAWIVKVEKLMKCDQCDKYYYHQQKQDHNKENCVKTKTSNANV